MDVSPDQHWFGTQGATNLNSANPTGTGGNRGIFPPSSAAMNRVGVGLGLPVLRASGACVPAHGGYGGGWVPLVAFKKVLCGILKYLGSTVGICSVTRSFKRDLRFNLEGKRRCSLEFRPRTTSLTLLTLTVLFFFFFGSGYVFAVNVHRVQLLLQVLSVRRFLHQQQQQQPQKWFFRGCSRGPNPIRLFQSLTMLQELLRS